VKVQKCCSFQKGTTKSESAEVLILSERNKKMNRGKGMADTKGAVLLKKKQQNENVVPLEKE